MARQLTLLEVPTAWRLDEATREVGRRGIAEARAKLQQALAGSQPSDSGREHPGHDRSAA